MFFEDDISIVIPAKAGIQEVFLFQINKRERVWIPNQVGDDSGVFFGDDSVCPFEDDIYLGFPNS